MPVSEEDAIDRERFAAELRASRGIEPLDFVQDSDGVFRVVVPREPPINLKLPRPQTAPHASQKPFKLKHKHKEVLSLAEKLDMRLKDYRFSGKAMLFEQLRRYKLEEKAKSVRAIEESGHHWVEENKDVQNYLSSEGLRLSQLSLVQENKIKIAQQKRNARQFTNIVQKMNQTKDVIKAKKMRQAAMAEFILQQSLRKNSAGQKSWLAILAITRAQSLLQKRLEEARRIRHRNAQMKAMTAVTIFVLHKFKAKRRKKSADEIVGFLRFIQRDGQIKLIAKKLKWILLKLQKLLLNHLACNHAMMLMICKKVDKVLAEYLPAQEAARAEREKKIRSKKSGRFSKKLSDDEEKSIQKKGPLEESVKRTQVKNWVVCNRQNHVTKLMAYEEYELWPVLVDMVREKAMFGNPLDARAFCKELRKKGSMYSWIIDNGGSEYIEQRPKYIRIPSDEVIIKEIYEKARLRSERVTKQKEDLEEMRLLMQKELGIGVDAEEERRLSSVKETMPSKSSGDGKQERTERRSANRTRRRSVSGGGKGALNTSSVTSDDSGGTLDSKKSRRGRRGSRL
ncbi:hypothetical protein TrVE_jg6251 [Triparma verrucosa]|uniref:Uncharacterized protein n=1 Tax=Triparma verrucosa TaxID=1606542 RepID=A0A9W7ES92_9STRA|nr:hypothetical protein TrVE_jg6251 [Triparma verrucosa]